MGLYLALNLSKRWKVFRSCRESVLVGSVSLHFFFFFYSQSVLLISSSSTHSVHVQGVDTQVKGCQVHALKHLHERLTLASFHMHDLLRVLLHGSFDEAQEMLLVHAGRGMNVCVHLQNK